MRALSSSLELLLCATALHCSSSSRRKDANSFFSVEEMLEHSDVDFSSVALSSAHSDDSDLFSAMILAI
jgi:hypothetical protein